jgi:hypothetical protein
VLAAILTASLAPAVADTQAPLPPCLFSADKVTGAPRFEDFAVRTETVIHPARPVLDSPDAREFRTMLRNAAAVGPNFAGHYTVALWGCGSSCTAFALIDAKTGHVFINKNLLDVSTIYTDNGYPSKEPSGGTYIYNALVFRLDSRLLIETGAQNEDEKRDGVAFYEWTGSALKLLRFVPAAKACTRPIPDYP